MNINRTLAAVFLTLLFVAIAGSAYGLRYVPIGVGDGYNNPVLLWDRWRQEVCQVAFNHQPLYCAQVRP